MRAQTNEAKQYTTAKKTSNKQPATYETWHKRAELGDRLQNEANQHDHIEHADRPHTAMTERRKKLKFAIQPHQNQTKWQRIYLTMQHPAENKQH